METPRIWSEKSVAPRLIFCIALKIFWLQKVFALQSSLTIVDIGHMARDGGWSESSVQTRQIWLVNTRNVANVRHHFWKKKFLQFKTRNCLCRAALRLQPSRSNKYGPLISILRKYILLSQWLLSPQLFRYYCCSTWCFDIQGKYCLRFQLSSVFVTRAAALLTISETKKPKMFCIVQFQWMHDRKK